tara:strand:- start:3279 stop:3986 length:708 start_codon:yes stop_codon:yes gene_type:complete
MGIESSKWSWSIEKLEPTTKLVLVCLASFAKDCGCCYPSTNLVGKMCGLAQRTVQHHVKRLIDNGLLVRTKRGKGRTHSGFQLNLDKGFGTTCSATDCGAKASSVASPISISKDIDIKNYKEELTAPEWLQIIDLTTDVGLVENANHPQIQNYISDIEKDFPHVDLVSEAKKYSLWWEGKKAKKPKLAFRNWLEKANKNEKPKERTATGTSNTVSNRIDDRTRLIAELQEKFRNN